MIDNAAIELLDIPYPYRAMLAICSDLDETPSAATYLSTSKYLNTGETTSFGTGVKLEVGNSIYFYMRDGDFSYWNASDDIRSAVRELIRSGHVDCIHSFGDTAVTREQAAKTLEHLTAHDCRIKVWIDHAVAPSNFGADIMQGRGDVAGDSVYHADISMQYGIRYVWRGRVTSMQGQDTPASIGGIWRRDEPVRSAITAGKEGVKVMLAHAGNRKYALHRDNRLLVETRLRDGRHVLEFLRCNPHPLGISSGDHAAGLALALSDSYLDRLAARSGKSVIYTHLGKQVDPRSGLPGTTRHVLEKLADRQQRGEILVTTTARILDYTRLRQQLSWSAREVGGVTEIILNSGTECQNYDGLSFRAAEDRDYRIVAEGKIMPMTRVPSDRAGVSIVAVPWRKLDYGIA